MEGSNQERGGERVKADPPKVVQSPVEKPEPSDAEAINARANAIDEETAGDGVAFFEGGDGREEARGDMERGG